MELRYWGFVEYEEKTMSLRSYAFVLAALAAVQRPCGGRRDRATHRAGVPSQGIWPQSQASFPQTNVGGWGGGWGGGMHASTAEQGAMMGMADMMQAAGSRNLMNSQALGFVEDAQRKNIDNRMYGTEAYFQMQKTNREARGRGASEGDAGGPGAVRSPAGAQPLESQRTRSADRGHLLAADSP